MAADQKLSRNRRIRKCKLVASATVLWTLPLFLPAIPAFARSRHHIAYGEGFITNIHLPSDQVAKVVEEVAANGIIRGTKEYNKDQYVTGAEPSTTTQVFPPWRQGGKVFYKVRKEALDPRGFKDSGDVGTLVVRYVVQPQGQTHSVLRIDALFQENFKHTIHPSDGSVEIAEYGDIQDHVAAIQTMNEENAEAEKEHEEQLAKKENTAAATDPQPSTPPESSSSNIQPAVENPPVTVPPVAVARPAPAADTPSATQSTAASPLGQTLEQRVANLRNQVERVVKAPGAPLKSAPFHSASTLQSLPTGTELLIEISTPYWYGVETHDGQHGWVLRDDLEQK